MYTYVHMHRFVLCVLPVFTVVALFVGLILFEAPVVGILSEEILKVPMFFGLHIPDPPLATDPPAYIKSGLLNVVEQSLLGECRAPGQVSFTGPEINAVHFIWVTTESGCAVNLKTEHYCAIESSLEHLPGIPITLWIAQPPIAYIKAKNHTALPWSPCDRNVSKSVPTRMGVRNVTGRPLVATNATILGRWYNEPGHALFLWTFKQTVPLAELSDFHRILILQQYGGLYTDLDYQIISPQVRFIEDGAGREFTGLKGFGGHAVSNAFLKFSLGSPVLDDIAMDMIQRIDDRWNPWSFGYIGMGSVTRTYLSHRFRKGCSRIAWAAYGRKTVFQMSWSDCADFRDNVVVGLHWKLQNRNNDTCQEVVRALQLACPVALSIWDKAHGFARP